MQDRVPLYPGRVKLTPVSGQENTYDMVRADQPTQEGMKLSKATLFDAAAEKAIFNNENGNHTPAEAFAALPNIFEPVGTIKTTVRTDLGDKWLLCNGASVDPATYPELCDILPAADPGGIWSAFEKSGVTYFTANNKVFMCSNGTQAIVLEYADTPYGPWTTVNIPTASNNSFGVNSIKYINGYYVIVGFLMYTAPYIFYTKDLDGTWSKCAINDSNAGDAALDRRAVDIIYSENTYIIAGYHKDGNALCVWESSSLAGTWTRYSVVGGTGGYYTRQIIYAEGYYVMPIYKYTSGYSPSVAYTTNITGSWTTKTLNSSITNYNPYKIEYKNGMWIALGTMYGSNSMSPGGTYMHRIFYSTSFMTTWSVVALTLPNITSGNNYSLDMYFDGTLCSVVTRGNDGYLYVQYNKDFRSNPSNWESNKLNSVTDTNYPTFFIVELNGSIGIFYRNKNVIYYISKNQLPVLTDSRVYHYIKAKE